MNHPTNTYEKKSLKQNLKEFWHWLWNSESIWSYIVFLIILFVLVKFIFLPGLGLAFHSALPMAIVESSSMEHYSLQLTQSNYEICGTLFSAQKFFNKEQYWNTCGNWYEQNTNITQQEFQDFSLSNGFRKGDIMIIWGWKQPKIGDVIVFNSERPNPIIHRIIKQNSDGSFQTKGDHNPAQIKDSLTDETNVQQNQIIGTAVLRIPYLGWIKLFFVELLQKI